MNNDFLEDIKRDNKNYEGKMKSLTFVVERDGKARKIFKWLFIPNNIDFFIAFPYFKSPAYYCGSVEVPEKPSIKGMYNAVKNGNASSEPVKFSYHQDGNIHFKKSNFKIGSNKAEKLAQLKAAPITDLDGGHLFTILFEGLDKFDELKRHSKGNGDEECLLRVPDDIVNFEILAYAGSTQKSLEDLVKKGGVPWFELKGKSTDGKSVYIGVYAILSRKSHIVDNNKNGLFALVGFDRSNLKETGMLKSLYLFAR